MSDQDPPSSTAGLGRHAARGAAYTVVGQICRVVLQLASVVILARLLSPNDYGLVAMVMAVIAVADIFRDLGLSAAAIQAPTLSRHQRDNLFWINSGIGLALAVGIAAGAPLVAAIYRNPDLVGLTRALAVVFLLNGMSTQYRAGLNRALRFKALAGIDVASPAIALAMGVAFALAGFGFWALAFQQIAQALANLVLLVITAAWVPGRPRRDVPMQGLIRFGWNLVAAQLVNYIGNNADSFVIGVRFGATPLGFYSRGFQLVFNPVNQLRAPASAVAIPVLSRIQDESERYFAFALRGQVFMGYTLVAGLGLVISGSVPITAIMLGPTWAEVAPILSLLSVAAIFQTLGLVSYWIYVSKGVTGSLFRYTFISVAIKIVCILVGSRWGVVGVAAGYGLSSTLAWPISLWWLNRTTPVPVRAFALGVLRMSGLAAAGCVVGFAAVRATSAYSSVVQVVADLVVTVLVYVVAWALFRPVRRDVSDVLELASFMRRGGPRAAS